jgi:hypothetical protein
MTTKIKVHKLVHKLFLAKKRGEKMTEMILKWNPAYEKYGAIYRGNWYKKWLPTQQEMSVDGVKCTLQYRPDCDHCHGYYVTCDPEKILDGLQVDLPFEPHIVQNLVY